MDNYELISIKATSQIYKLNIDPNNNILKLALDAINEEYHNQHERIECNLKCKFRTSWKSHEKNQKFIPLVDYVTKICNNLLIEKSYDFLVKCDNCWGAIYEFGDYAVEHNHTPFVLSAIVYLKLDDKSSNLFFEDSEIKLREGDIVIFPGSLNHRVSPTAGERIIVSMNFGLMPNLFSTF